MLVAFAPLPAWVLGALLAFHASASQVRQQYIVELEEEMARQGDGTTSYRRYPRFTTLQMGLYLPSSGSMGPFLLSVLTLITPLIVVLAYSIFVIWTIGTGAGLSLGLQIAASVVYAAILTLSLWVIGWVMGHTEFLHHRAESKLQDAGKERIRRQHGGSV